MEWQPIETAPRDGTSVLLLGRGGRYADGFWEPKAYSGNGCWVWPYVKCEPTNWMPLPGQEVGAGGTANPVAWIRFCSDGGYEGPIADCDKRMDDARRKSGAWTPLYTHNT